MNKWDEGDNAFRALVEWKHTRFSGVGKIFTGSRMRLMWECVEIVHKIANVWLRAWGEDLSTFDHEYFVSHIRSGLCLGAVRLPVNQAVIDYLLYYVDEELTHQGGKELSKPIQVHLRSQIRSVFFSTIIVDAPWNIKDMLTLRRLTCIWKNICYDFLLVVVKGGFCRIHYSDLT